MKKCVCLQFLIPMLTTVIANFSPRVDYSGYQLLEVDRPLNSNQLNYLSKKVDFWSEPYDKSVAFSVSPLNRLEVHSYLQNQSFEYELQIPDLQQVIEDELIENFNEEGYLNNNHSVSKRDTLWQIFAESVQNVTNFRRGRKISAEDFGSNDNAVSSSQTNEVVKISSFMDWTRYHRIEVIYAWMERLANEHRDFVKLQRIGKTAEGRDILVIKIGLNSSPRKPGIFIEGGIHAREWISPASVTYLINELVNNPSLTDLIENLDFYILPIMNPDGYAYTHTTDRMWRKNRALDDSFLTTLTQCRGVDLNRNWGYKWGTVSLLDNPQHGTGLPCLETYMGKGPFSEHETQAVRNFILAHPRKFASYITFHSFGSKIMYPWSYANLKVKDWKELHNLGVHLAEGIFEASRGKDRYEVGTASSIQYTATGGSDDWARGVANIKYVYLIELPGKGKGFLLPHSWIQHVGTTNVEMIRRLSMAILNRI